MAPICLIQYSSKNARTFQSAVSSSTPARRTRLTTSYTTALRRLASCSRVTRPLTKSATSIAMTSSPAMRPSGSRIHHTGLSWASPKTADRSTAHTTTTARATTTARSTSAMGCGSRATTAMSRPSSILMSWAATAQAIIRSIPSLARAGHATAEGTTRSQKCSSTVAP